MSSNQSLGHKLDIFSFTPVPTGQTISTRKSRYGTYIFIFVYLVYISKVFYAFLYANTPRINQFSNSLDDDLKYKAPRMAFAFLTGDNLNSSVYDETYFTFNFYQVATYQDPNKKDTMTPITLERCRPDWLNPVFDVFCPTKDTYLQGLKYGSPVNLHPALEIVLCDSSKKTCAKKDDINWQIMTGRFFVFLEQYSSYDYVSGKQIIDDSPYVSYYYFLVYDQFNRAELKIEAQNVTMKPNMMTSFFDTQLNQMAYAEQTLYVSRVPTTDKQSLFLWWCNMSDSIKITTVVFDTLLDVMSKVGAMWTLLFTAFAFYFLRFNQAKYYSRKPHMMNFDDRISPLVAAAEPQAKSNMDQTNTSSDDSNNTNRSFSTLMEKVGESQLEAKLNSEKKM